MTTYTQTGASTKYKYILDRLFDDCAVLCYAVRQKNGPVKDFEIAASNLAQYQSFIAESFCIRACNDFHRPCSMIKMNEILVTVCLI